MSVIKPIAITVSVVAQLVAYCIAWTVLASLSTTVFMICACAAVAYAASAHYAD